jgi:drug/metabolite transporter (DMT)-like permease
VSTAGAGTRRFPPVAQLASASLALVVVGGVYMASWAPRRPPLEVPVALLLASSLLLVVAVAMLARLRDFAWTTFTLVGRWALLAYVISAGMIEYAFIHNRTQGDPLLVVSLLLVLFAVDVPLIIAFTVARYQTRTSS